MPRNFKIRFPRERRAQPLTFVRVHVNPATKVVRLVISGIAPARAKTFRVDLLSHDGVTVALAEPTQLVLVKRPRRHSPTFAISVTIPANAGNPGVNLDDRAKWYKLTLHATTRQGNAIKDEIAQVVFHTTTAPPAAVAPDAPTACAGGMTAMANGAFEFLFPAASTPHYNEGFVAYGTLAGDSTGADYPVIDAYLEDAAEQSVPADILCTDPDGFWFVSFGTIPDEIYTLVVVTADQASHTVANLDISSSN